MVRILVFLVIVLIIGIFSAISWADPKQFEPNNTKVSGVAAVGGDFTLIDHYKKPFTQDALKGKYSLVFFGFTHCPDICPTALLTVSHVLESLGDKANQLQTLFISVDPERDTPEVIAKYVANFHPSIVGLTGTGEQVKQVSDAYKVYSSKVEPAENGMGYMMDHSAYIFLMDKNGQYITHFPSTISEQVLLEKINQEIQP